MGAPLYVFDLIESWATGHELDFHGHPVPADVYREIARIAYAQKVTNQWVVKRLNERRGR